MNNVFGTILREKRRQVGLSQRELAEQIGLDFSYISKVENGRLPPPAADTIVLICRVLGIPAEELLALTGKIPSVVQQTIGMNPAAQEFLRHAQEMGLTEDEWKQIGKSLKVLRGQRK